MAIQITVSDTTAPFVLDAINNHMAMIVRGADGGELYPDEVRALAELKAAAEKLRRRTVVKGG